MVFAPRQACRSDHAGDWQTARLPPDRVRLIAPRPSAWLRADKSGLRWAVRGSPMLLASKRPVGLPTMKEQAMNNEERRLAKPGLDSL
jgi:hypothetical protein